MLCKNIIRRVNLEYRDCRSVLIGVKCVFLLVFPFNKNGDERYRSIIMFTLDFNSEY